MVEVFKTNVVWKHQADTLLQQLYLAFPDYRMNFDLDDCDRILRVQSPGHAIPAQSVMAILRQAGFQCDVLEG